MHSSMQENSLINRTNILSSYFWKKNSKIHAKKNKVTFEYLIHTAKIHVKLMRINLFASHCIDRNKVAFEDLMLQKFRSKYLGLICISLCGKGNITISSSKPSRKIESVNKAFLFWYWQGPKKYIFRNKTFLFFKIESWNFQHLFEKGFHEISQNFNSIRQQIEKWK